MRKKKGFIETLLGFTLAIVMGTLVLFAGANPLQVSPVQDELYVVTGMKWNVNVTFLVTEEGVLVVDSGNNTTEGRWILEKIKEKTGKPIKYVILTHYHFDHTLGLLAFPKEITVIAHSNCAQNIAQFSEERFKYLIEKALPRQIRELHQKIAALKKENNPDAKEQEKELQKLNRELEDYKKGKLVYPAVTFDKKLTLQMGKEKIQIIYPGPTHTNGNVLVYIPGRKVIIMGDMLFHGSFPFIDRAAGSDTRNWTTWMERLSQWDIEKVIPGHGEPTDKNIFARQKRYLSDLRNSVKEAIDKGLSLEEMKKTIKMTGYKDWQFYFFLSGNIDAVYHELKNNNENK